MRLRFGASLGSACGSAIDNDAAVNLSLTLVRNDSDIMRALAPVRGSQRPPAEVTPLG